MTSQSHAKDHSNIENSWPGLIAVRAFCCLRMVTHILYISYKEELDYETRTNVTRNRCRADTVAKEPEGFSGRYPEFRDGDNRGGIEISGTAWQYGKAVCRWADCPSANCIPATDSVPVLSEDAAGASYAVR